MKLEKKRCINQNCNRILPKENITGYCRKCYTHYASKQIRRKKKSEKVCYDCGKIVNPIITYPDGLNGPKEIQYPIRCYSCRIKQNKYFKKWLKK